MDNKKFEKLIDLIINEDEEIEAKRKLEEAEAEEESVLGKKRKKCDASTPSTENDQNMDKVKRPKSSRFYDFLLSNQMGEMEELLARHRNEQMDLLARHRVQREDFVMHKSPLKKMRNSDKQTHQNADANDGSEMADLSQKIDEDGKISDDSHKSLETESGSQCDQFQVNIKLVKKRNPKIPGTRAHRKTKEYAEGRDIIPEIKLFFSDKIEECEGNRVFCSDLLVVFKQYRIDKGNAELSSLQEELFWRHGKKIFLEQFPKCRFTAYKHQRCYLGVRLK